MFVRAFTIVVKVFFVTGFNVAALIIGFSGILSYSCIWTAKGCHYYYFYDVLLHLTINPKQSSVKFMDGSAVPRKSQAKYLGATLTDAIDNHQEVMRRTGEATAVAKQLGLFWSKARTTIKWKLRVMESIVFNKWYTA